MVNIKNLLEQVYLNPEKFNFELKGTMVYLVQKQSLPIHIGDLDVDIPRVVVPLLRIKSWRLDKNSDNVLSLAVNLII